MANTVFLPCINMKNKPNEVIVCKSKSLNHNKAGIDFMFGMSKQRDIKIGKLISPVRIGRILLKKVC